MVRADTVLNLGFQGCRERKWPLIKVGPLSTAFQRSSIAKNLITKKPFPKHKRKGTNLRFQMLISFSVRISLERMLPQRRTMTESDQGAWMIDFSDSVTTTERMGGEGI